MAGLEIMAERTRTQEYEAGVEAYTTDMAYLGRPGQDNKNTGIKLCQGTHSPGRVHVRYNRQGNIRSKRVCGEAVRWNGIVQGLVV